MYQNAGFISLLYPFAVFGYALMEETRPTEKFWDFMLKYTIFVLMVKFTLNLEILDPFIGSEYFTELNSYLKLGIQHYSDIWSLFLYMTPEIFILFTILKY
jgi:hypothetical protein